MKKNKIIYIGIAILLTAGIGIFSGIKISQYKNEKYNNLKQETLDYLGEEHKKEDIEKKLKTNFQKLSKEDTTNIMDVYLHATYTLASQCMINDEMSNEIYGCMDENNQFDFDKIENEETKEFCGIMAEQNIIPRFVNGNLFFDVDYEYFIEQYGSYMQEEYVEVLRLYNEEKLNDYYNSGEEKMYYDTVEKRLLAAYDLMQKYPESKVIQSLTEYYSFYKKVYLGAYAQDYIYDTGAILKEDILSHYMSFVDRIKDPELKTFLQELIKEYQISERTRTSEIYESIKKFCNISTD